MNRLFERCHGLADVGPAGSVQLGRVQALEGAQFDHADIPTCLRHRWRIPCEGPSRSNDDAAVARYGSQAERREVPLGLVGAALGAYREAEAGDDGRHEVGRAGQAKCVEGRVQERVVLVEERLGLLDGLVELNEQRLPSGAALCQCRASSLREGLEGGGIAAAGEGSPSREIRKDNRWGHPRIGFREDAQHRRRAKRWDWS